MLCRLSYPFEEMIALTSLLLTLFCCLTGKKSKQNKSSLTRRLRCMFVDSRVLDKRGEY